MTSVEEKTEIWLGYDSKLANAISGLTWCLYDQNGKPLCQSDLPASHQSEEYRSRPGVNGYNPVLQYATEKEALKVGRIIVKARGLEAIPDCKIIEETIKRLQQIETEKP